LLGACSKTGAKHRKRVPPLTETHKKGIGPAQKTHGKGHRKMAFIDHIASLSLPPASAATTPRYLVMGHVGSVCRGRPVGPVLPVLAGGRALSGGGPVPLLND
jgi:hypothetical protein